MVVDGVELLRMIRDGEIDKNKKIYIKSDKAPFRFYITSGIYNAIHLYRVEGKKEVEVRVLDTSDLLTDKYIIPEKEEIDIDSIEELNDTNYDSIYFDEEQTDYYHNSTRSKLNDLIKAVKQLNRKIKGE